MLIQFSVTNFKTFKNKATLSLVASAYDKKTREVENVIINKHYKFKSLKSAVIYGANASGKSKFIDALMFMRDFAISSSIDTQKGDDIPVEPFKLNIDTLNSTSEFEIIFLHKNIMYRYGFEVNQNIIVAEWLYNKPKTKEVELFYREFQDIKTHSKNFKKGSIVVKERLLRDNTLLLSLTAQLNDSISINIIDWFKSLKIISGLKDELYKDYTIQKMNNPDYKNKILALLQAADLDIQNMELKKVDKELEKQKSSLVADILTTHKRFNNSGEYIDDYNLSLFKDESSGTRKLFAFAGPILDVLENGYILVVDELDSKLHPNLVNRLIALFNSKTHNPNNAQLIFNTHDLNLLSTNLFRRDQIWFTEKNKFGEAKLYSLADFKSKGVRKTEAFEENYIRGKYGAIPYLNFFDDLYYEK